MTIGIEAIKPPTLPMNKDMVHYSTLYSTYYEYKPYQTSLIFTFSGPKSDSIYVRSKERLPTKEIRIRKTAPNSTALRLPIFVTAIV